MTGNAVSAKANIEVKKLEHCNQISSAQKSAMVIPLCNIISKAHGNENEPLQYVLSHPELLNHEIADWAFNLAQAYFDAIPYLEVKGQEWYDYNNSAYNLACVAHFVARELKYFSIGIQSMDLQIKLAQIAGANMFVIMGMKNDLNKLRKMAGSR